MVISNRTPKNGVRSIFIIIVTGFIVGGMTAWFITYLHQLDLASSSLILMILFLLMSGMGMVMALSSGDLLTPQYLLPSIYLFAFGVGSYLLNIELVDLNTEGYPISLLQWSYYILGIVAYLFGFYCSKIFFANNSGGGTRLIEWDYGRLVIVIFVLGIIGTLVRMILFMRVGVPILSSNVDVLRTAQRDVGGVLVTMIWFSNASVHLASYFIINAKVNRYVKILVGLFLIFLVFTMMLGGGRQQVAIAVIAFVIMYHYSRRKLTLKTMILFTLAIFVFIGGVGVYRIYARYGLEYINFLSSQGIPLYLSWVPEFAKQLSMGVDGFAFVIRTIPYRVDYRYGWVVFSSFLHFLPGRQQILDDWVKELSGLQWAGFGRPVSMLGGFYVDGGPIGILLGMFVVGFFIYLLYNKVKFAVSPIWLLLYSLWMPRLMSAWRNSLSAPYDLVLGPAILLLTHLYVQKSKSTNIVSKLESVEIVLLSKDNG